MVGRPFDISEMEKTLPSTNKENTVGARNLNWNTERHPLSLPCRPSYRVIQANCPLKQGQNIHDNSCTSKTHVHCCFVLLLPYFALNIRTFYKVGLSMDPFANVQSHRCLERTIQNPNNQNGGWPSRKKLFYTKQSRLAKCWVCKWSKNKMEVILICFRMAQKTKWRHQPRPRLVRISSPHYINADTDSIPLPRQDLNNRHELVFRSHRSSTRNSYRHLQPKISWGSSEYQIQNSLY